LPLVREDHLPPTTEDPFKYNRIQHFERSASFGFEQDKLGRLNEINHTQVQDVIRGSHYANFRHTNHNFMNHFKSQKVSIPKIPVMKNSENLKEENGPVLNIDFADPYQVRNHKSLERNKHTIGASYDGLQGIGHHSVNPQAASSSRP